MKDEGHNDKIVQPLVEVSAGMVRGAFPQARGIVSSAAIKAKPANLKHKGVQESSSLNTSCKCLAILRCLFKPHGA